MASSTKKNSRSRNTSSWTGTVAPPELVRFAEFCDEILRLEDGSQFKLYPEQMVMLADYFAGTTETLILVPKKNGKTSLLAALAIWHLLTTEDADCVIAAASRDQASVLLRQARGFIRRSEGLQGYLTVKQREIVRDDDDGRIRVLAADADTADGVIPTLALVDELHRHKSPDLYGVFRDGLGPRNGQLITISTAGDFEDSPLGRMRRDAYDFAGFHRDSAYRNARSADGSFVMHEWALDADDNLHDMTVVKRANPAPWQTEDALRRRHDSPSMTSWQWARFACGVWVQGEDAAIAPTDWAACAERGIEIPEGQGIWLGIDLGWKWDTTAVVPYWKREDDKAQVGAPRILVPPRDGTSLREDAIKSVVRDFKSHWTIEGIVIDPQAGGEQFAQWLEDELGLTVIAHSQDPSPMSDAAQRLMTAIRERQIVHPDDQDLNAHVLAGHQKTVSGEKWKFVKPKRGGRVIDALIALAMVHSIASDHSGHSVYEDRDLITV